MIVGDGRSIMPVRRKHFHERRAGVCRGHPSLLRTGRPEMYDDPVKPGADMYGRRSPPPPRR